VTHELDHEPERDIDPGRVRRVRLGHGANCSSIGSVVDTLFATATVGAAVFAAVVAALAKEPVKVVQREPRRVPERRGGRAP
jgi:hypothetical protein